jgi:hypothetical protein
MKTGNNLKDTQVYLTGNPKSAPLDSRMSPNHPRGTGKSIGGDLNVDDEGSKQHQFEYKVVLDSELDSNSTIPNWIGSSPSRALLIGSPPPS